MPGGLQGAPQPGTHVEIVVDRQDACHIICLNPTFAGEDFHEVYLASTMGGGESRVVVASRTALPGGRPAPIW